MEKQTSFFWRILWTLFAGAGVYAIFKVLSWLQYNYVIRSSIRKNWPSRPHHWFWGHMELITLINRSPEKMIGFVREMSRQFTHGSAIYIGPLITLVRVTHEGILKKVLGGSEKKFPKSIAQYHSLRPWLGVKGLLILGGKEWQRHRHLLSNSFHFDILRSYTIKMNRCSKTLVEKWNRRLKKHEDATIEVFEDFSLMTIDAIMKCLMGFECNSQIEDGEHRRYVNCIYNTSKFVNARFRSQNILMRSDFIYNLTPTGKRYLEFSKDARDYAEKVITLRRKEYADGVTIGAKLGLNRKRERHYDFLDILLQAKDSDGNHLTDIEVSDEVNTFIFEGHDTTTSAISWTCFCLASNPECQEKCYDEVVEILAEKHDVAYEDLSKFTYLNMCIKESLRMYPPVPSIARQPTEDFDACGKPLKRGTELVISILGSHFNPVQWPDPEEFDPLRFTPENTAKRDPYAYVPFSAGLRNCIGQNFAMNEIKICLAHVLRDFEMSLDEERPVVPCVELILRARGGLHLLVKKRKNR